jgi:hypothetical protein
MGLEFDGKGGMKQRNRSDRKGPSRGRVDEDGKGRLKGWEDEKERRKSLDRQFDRGRGEIGGGTGLIGGRPRFR